MLLGCPVAWRTTGPTGSRAATWAKLASGYPNPNGSPTYLLRREFWIAFMDEVTILPHLTALGIAYLLAIPIAWDREKEDRSAGLRTFPLVAIATCGFVEGTENFLRGSPEAQARVIEGLITGVGFIGGGAILRHGASVHGTATAASLWATGAVGVASALGAYEVAGLIAVVTFLTLRFLAPLKRGTPSAGKPD